MTESQADPSQQDISQRTWDTLVWWLALITAVLAVPSLGFLIVTLTGVTGMISLFLFMIVCWACTYLGMNLIQQRKASDGVDASSTDATQQPVNADLPWETMTWWIVLIAAVIAVPSLGFLILAATGAKGFVGMVVFLGVCWACTFLGVYLMGQPNVHKKKNFTVRT